MVVKIYVEQNGMLSILIFDEVTMKVGDKAPDFTLQAHDGTVVRLSDFRGKKNVVVFFYPKDDTPG